METPEGEVDARFYSTKLGRFLSADPLVAGAGGLTANLCIDCTPSAGKSSGGAGVGRSLGTPSSGQELDRYSYVLNNPLRYCDPSGLCITDPFTGKRLDCSGDIAYRMAVCSTTSGEHCERIARFQQERGIGGLEGVDLDKLGRDDWENVHKYFWVALWGNESTKSEFHQSVHDIDWGADDLSRHTYLYEVYGFEGPFQNVNRELKLNITLHYNAPSLSCGLAMAVLLHCLDTPTIFGCGAAYVAWKEACFD